MTICLQVFGCNSANADEFVLTPRTYRGLPGRRHLILFPRETLDHRTAAVVAPITFPDQRGKGFFHLSKVGDPRSDAVQLLGRKVSDLVAVNVLARGQAQKRPDFIEREAQLPAAPDESEPFDIAGPKVPIPPAARRRIDDPDPLIVADGLDIASGLRRKGTNSHLSLHPLSL